MTRTPNALFAFSLASISLIGPLAVHLFMPVIPAVKAALGLSDAVAQFTFSLALFGMSCATLFYGPLSDRYGRRPLLLSGLGLFLLGSVLSLLANSVAMLVAGRLLQAVGAGCGVTLARAIASDVYGRAKLVEAIAYLTMFYTLGPMISPLVGGILIDVFGWRSVFGFALLMGGGILGTAFFAIFETRQAGRSAADAGLLQGYAALLRSARFCAFVLQSGFSTATFLATATAASTLMKELLQRPSSEFGLYFLLFPFGYLTGSFVSTRLGGRVANERMVLIGSLMSVATIAVQSALLLTGHVAPLTLFLPGFFITLAQGIALPFSQAGAIAVKPQFSGTAAGLGVFTQNFLGGLFAQLYGLFADGTPTPLVITTAISGGLCLAAGITPTVLRRRDGAKPAM